MRLFNFFKTFLWLTQKCVFVLNSLFCSVFQNTNLNFLSNFIAAGQLSQSAHFALQLPYNVLGLGRSANFLDHLYVGIPRPLGEKVS